MFCTHIITTLQPGLKKEVKFLELDEAVPDGHEGDPKEEAEGASHLGNHGGRVVQQHFSLNRGVPGWGRVPEPSVPVCQLYLD